MLSRLATLGVATLAATAIACSRAPAPQSGAIPQDAVLTVANDHWLDVNVYALRAGTRHRVGTVTGQQSDTIPLRTNIIAAGTDVRLIAEPIGMNQSYVSDPVYVNPGAWVALTVRSPLNLSSLTTWQP